jgi:hypothetical protein
MKKIIYGFIVFNLLTFHVKETNACCGESCDICHERLTWCGAATPALRNAHKTTAMINGPDKMAHGAQVVRDIAEHPEVQRWFRQAMVWIGERLCPHQD